jgi:diguanylate cyclase (GGDEF)-like protein
MNGYPNNVEVQQIVELLEVVSSFADEAAATQGAVERAAQALEAEVAAVVIGGRVVKQVGFPAAAVPHAALAAAAAGSADTVDVPGPGRCFTATAALDGPEHGQLVLARSGEVGFTVEEYNLVRGMARILGLTLQMIRTLDSLRRRQRLTEALYGIQRGIARRMPLREVLDRIVDGVHDLLGDVTVGLLLLDSNDRHLALLAASRGLHGDAGKRLWRIPVAEAGAAGQAIRGDGMVCAAGYAGAGEALRQLTGRALRQSMATPVHENGEVAGSLLVAAADGGHPFSDADQEILLAFAEHVSIALTDAKTLNDMHEAFHDSLTRLASRPLFLDRLQDGLDHARREEGWLALLFIDLDRFKEVNDTLGHAAGDLILIGAAERLQEGLRSGDVASRFGGDEFAIMLRDVTVPQAVGIAERLIASLSSPFTVGGRPVSIGASIGIALFRGNDADPDTLLRQADAAMYEAKRNGRGRVEIFRDGMEANLPQHQLDAELRRALDEITQSVGRDAVDG